MSEPTELDLIKLELRDLMASVGEIRLGWNAVMSRLADMEARLRTLEAQCNTCGTPDTTFTGSIQGLDGEWTVTPPPEFEA